MSMRTLLLVALLLGGGALAWFSLQPNEAPAAPPVTTRHILVASQATQAGALLKDADFVDKELPEAQVPEDSVPADEASRAEIRGALLRRYLEGGEVVHRKDVLRPRDRGFLAAVLAPGTRAVSIGVDATTGASGLISPGDLVDVILSQEFQRGDTPVGHRVVAETVLSKARVIAVDQQIAQGAPTTGTVLPSQSTRVASTISLEVTPEEAARVVVAERLGRLTLVVRSIDTDPAPSREVASTTQAAPPPAAPARTDGPVAPGGPIAPSGPIERVAGSPTSVFGADVSAALARDQPVTNPRLRVIQGDTVNDVVFH